MVMGEEEVVQGAVFRILGEEGTRAPEELSELRRIHTDATHRKLAVLELPEPGYVTCDRNSVGRVRQSELCFLIAE